MRWRRVKRALVIRKSALGDVVLTEPVIRALQSAHPEIAVDLATDRRYLPLMERAGYARVLPLTGTEVLAERYDLVIDLQGKLRTRSLARRIRADRKLTLRKRSAAKAVLSLFGYDPPIADRHSTALYLSVLEQAGIPTGAIDRAPRLLRRVQPEELLIGLVPGATHETKQWLPARFGELADRLQRELPDAAFVPIGGQGDERLIAQVLATARRARFLPDTTALDLTELTDRIERLSLMISVDTGPAHVAAALGVPVVVLFGPTSPVRWGPIGERHRALSLGLECAPCSNTGGPRCPLPGSPHACMRDLPVDLVEGAALAALQGRA